jgi:CheY-like chemotaxis protein
MDNESDSMPFAPPLSTGAPISSTESEKVCILLAEDDPITSQVVELMFKCLNFDLHIVGNGFQALEKWEQGNYDLILMDVEMPHMDGLAATGAIREKERAKGGHTLIVAVTAHVVLPEDEKRYLAAGMDAYIPKPIDLQQCIAMIEKLIGKEEL